MKILSEKLTVKEAKDSSLADMIYDAIIDEWQTIKLYDEIIGAAKANGIDKIVDVIDDIKEEENRHVGQLQQVLSTLNRDIKPIAAGEKEAKGQVEK